MNIILIIFITAILAYQVSNSFYEWRCNGPRDCLVFYWRYTFNYNGFIIPYVGIIINKSLVNHPNCDDLIEHEYIHWRQWRKYKSATVFIFLYLLDIWYHGYDLSLFEIEARIHENKWVKYNYTEAVRLGVARTPGNPNFRKGKKIRNAKKV